MSCTSSSYCEAVGYRSGSGELNLAERWNGTAWAAQSTPSQPGGSSLRGVSCTSTDFCMAVGGFFSEIRDGTRWTIHPVATA